MPDELNVIVVQVQTTGDWDVSCFNPICGEGIHDVGESPSKGRADAMARRHRLQIAREIERQGEPPAIVNWQTRAEEAEEALDAARQTIARVTAYALDQATYRPVEADCLAAVLLNLDPDDLRPGVAIAALTPITEEKPNA